MFRQLIPDSVSPIDKPFYFSVHKHRSLNTGHNAGHKRKSTNLCFQAVFRLGSRVLVQAPTQIGAVFRHFAPNSALPTPIDNPLNFQHINTGHNAGHKRKSINLSFHAVYALGSRVLFQAPTKFG